MDFCLQDTEDVFCNACCYRCVCVYCLSFYCYQVFEEQLVLSLDEEEISSTHISGTQLSLHLHPVYHDCIGHEKHTRVGILCTVPLRYRAKLNLTSVLFKWAFHILQQFCIIGNNILYSWSDITWLDLHID